ncbi:AraC family transcriptional regulator [Chitinophaga sp. CF418]|uniref:AraC family transcriptional regulator n=1 Tax=Chitinophaga sp. CF418 TaxID=1855287 RepID=UPI00091340BE|nr:AraC family transcriptional regulator [Chitinophaga sp. CF418]SHN45684.1 AraC-type DNA-binding protein [Chitinophaga sp. CF418]
MYTSPSGVNKLLLLEKLNPNYVSSTSIPEEYQSLLIPAAGHCYREDAEADILSQHIDFGPFSLWTHDIWAKKDFVLCPSIPEHMWCLHGLYEDSLHFEDPAAPSYLLEEKEFNLFNLPKGLHRIPITEGKKVLSFHINIEQDVLKDMVEEFPSLEILANRTPAEAGAINTYPYHSNLVCDFLVEKILSCQYEPKRAYPFLFRACIDLLRNIAAQETLASQPLMSESVLNADKIHRLANYLREHPFIKHTLVQLGYIFKASGKQLAFEFKQHFALSIHEFMHMCRMMHIYDVMQKANTPTEKIAAISEYPNVTNMLIQLKDYYACMRSTTYQ